MTEEQLAAIPIRIDIGQILRETQPAMLQAVLEGLVNVEWWRGYYAGRRSLLIEARARGQARAPVSSQC